MGRRVAGFAGVVQGRRPVRSRAALCAEILSDEVLDPDLTGPRLPYPGSLRVAIHDVPNRSLSGAKRYAKKFSRMGIKISPPSESAA